MKHWTSLAVGESRFLTVHEMSVHLDRYALRPPAVRRYRDIDRFVPVERLSMARPCRVRLTLPAASGEGEVVFTCNQPRSHATPPPDGPETDHSESGRVRGKDGTIRGYTITWMDVGTEVWRQ